MIAFQPARRPALKVVLGHPGEGLPSGWTGSALTASCFAVDYPFEQTAAAVPFIRAAPLDDAAMRRITHENAQALFGIAAG